MVRWSVSSDEDLRAKPLCHYLCVKGHGKLSTLPSSVFSPPFFTPCAPQLLQGSFSCAIHVIRWIDGKTLCWNRNCPVSSVMLRKWEVETASGHLPGKSVPGLFTWVADDPLCGCCCENRPLMSLCNYICVKCICQAADGGREEKAQTDYAGFRVLLRETNLNICVKQAEKVNVTLLSNLSVS